MKIPVNDTYILVGAGRLWLPPFRSHGAGSVRDFILSEIINHDGDLFVIDDSFSEAIDSRFDSALVSALQRLFHRGARVGRYWGCESAPHPFRGWQGFGEENEALVFSNLENAVQTVGSMVLPGRIRIAGAWLGTSRGTGQVNEVLAVLQERGHSGIETRHRTFADPLRT